jgi:hypothetical protein
MADDKSTQRRRVACEASIVTFIATNLGVTRFIHHEFTANV